MHYSIFLCKRICSKNEQANKMFISPQIIHSIIFPLLQHTMEALQDNIHIVDSAVTIGVDQFLDGEKDTWIMDPDSEQFKKIADMHKKLRHIQQFIQSIQKALSMKFPIGFGVGTTVRPDQSQTIVNAKILLGAISYLLTKCSVSQTSKPSTYIVGVLIVCMQQHISLKTFLEQLEQETTLLTDRIKQLVVDAGMNVKVVSSAVSSSPTKPPSSSMMSSMYRYWTQSVTSAVQDINQQGSIELDADPVTKEVTDPVTKEVTKEVTYPVTQDKLSAFCQQLTEAFQFTDPAVRDVNYEERICKQIIPTLYQFFLYKQTADGIAVKGGECKKKKKTKQKRQRRQTQQRGFLQGAFFQKTHSKRSKQIFRKLK